MRTYRQIKQSKKERILKICSLMLNENSGIYILTREENGFKYAYIGQANILLTRLGTTWDVAH